MLPANLLKKVEEIEDIDFIFFPKNIPEFKKMNWNNATKKGKIIHSSCVMLNPIPQNKLSQVIANAKHTVSLTSSV